MVIHYNVQCFRLCQISVINKVSFISHFQFSFKTSTLMITAMQFIPRAPAQEGEIRRCLVNLRVRGRGGVGGGVGGVPLGHRVPYPIIDHAQLRLNSKIP